ncbi:MAG: Beta-lactamase domain protein [Candidatus Woesebacteria bacterium GW2011_GWA1_39_8]|uniref:Beta-lactamase domain protein n=1 Tax=Candidatus Woesebacteria bacterium GW2011_GWA1_39_8 TaxID=1618552 RepID=A0A0G0PXH3_9BACT|nr:MAG: Beta-lactamase domain protein [Candidatus Woesebacteria bacterium GW2011_GWA1_39_8]
MLEHDSKFILVDCGLLQDSREEKNFEPFKYNPAEVDFLLITHAHMDHIGKVPKLVKDGFKGKIISTVETMELSKPMLEDALRVMQSKFPNQKLFSQEDIQKAFSLWQGHRYGEKIELFENCFLEMQNAGHILGSAILNVTTSPPTPLLAKERGEKTITVSFTGDLGNSPSTLLPDTDIPLGADYIVMESVYGDRNHIDKKERRERLKEAILEGIKKEGTIIIPAFSIERTQVLLYELNNMIEDKEIPSVPVFLDSPLALKVTDIYKKYEKDFKKSVQEEIKKGDDIFDFPGLQIIKSAQDSAEIEKIKGARIILSGSGMSEGGRVVNHELSYLPDPSATIILVGYQAAGTLGRKLEDGAKEIEIKPPPPPPPPSPKGRGKRETNMPIKGK